MLKRTLGNILVTLGAPAGVGMWTTMGAFTSAGSTSSLLWSVPLTIVSLPLLPLYLKGESLLNECAVEDFKEKTKHLPQVHVSAGEYLYIEECDFGDWKGKFALGPIYDEEPFDSEQEARSFLEAQGYQEVIDLDNTHHHLWGTCWVKLDEENNNG